MNSVRMRGILLNTPRYDVIPSTSDAILRALLEVDGVIVPFVCCNERANTAWPVLQKTSIGSEIFVTGKLKGNSYTDAVGSKNYLLYLVVDNLGNSDSELPEENEFVTALKYEGLPFDVIDLEDILKYMEN